MKNVIVNNFIPLRILILTVIVKVENGNTNLSKSYFKNSSPKL